MGIYHHARAKYVPRDVDEFAFRLNEGNVKVQTPDRIESFVDGTAGSRLTDEALIQWRTRRR